MSPPMAYSSDTRLHQQMSRKADLEEKETEVCFRIDPGLFQFCPLPIMRVLPGCPIYPDFSIILSNVRGSDLPPNVIAGMGCYPCEGPSDVLNALCSLNSSLLVLFVEHCSKCCRSYRDELHRLTFSTMLPHYW